MSHSSERSTDFDSSVSNLVRHLENDNIFLNSLRSIFFERAQIEHKYLSSIQSLSQNLSNQVRNSHNSQVKSIISFICSDWMNLVQQKARVAEEFEDIVKQDIPNLISRQKSFIRDLTSKLKNIKLDLHSKLEHYKQLESNYKNSQFKLTNLIKQTQRYLHDKKIIEFQTEEKNKHEKQLFRLTRVLLEKKREYTKLLDNLTTSINLNQKKLENNLADLGMKNFILQVNYLKNREFDISHMIQNYNRAREASTARRASPARKLSFIRKQSVSRLPLNLISSGSSVFRLELPNKNFMSCLENNFYKNVHYDLLFRSRLGPPQAESPGVPENSACLVNFYIFHQETILLSKLFDRKQLLFNEKKIVSNLYLKSQSGPFVLHFLKSFLKYKRGSLAIRDSSMRFFVENVLEKILAPLMISKKYLLIFELIQQLQIVKISSKSGSTTILVNDSSFFDPLNTSNERPRSSSPNRSMFAEDQASDFADWIKGESNCIQEILRSPDFWGFSLRRIFSNQKADRRRLNERSRSSDVLLKRPKLISQTSRFTKGIASSLVQEPFGQGNSQNSSIFNSINMFSTMTESSIHATPSKSAGKTNGRKDSDQQKLPQAQRGQKQIHSQIRGEAQNGGGAGNGVEFDKAELAVV